MSGAALVILLDNVAGPASQKKLQSGHCCFEDVSQSSKISVLFMSAMRSFDSLLNSFEVLKERFFVRVVLSINFSTVFRFVSCS